MERRNRLWTGALFALLALTALIPLGVPIFPTQDGPVHLYYVDVLRGLLTHSAPYTQHFRIKSILTPYSLEYYFLLALEFVFSSVFSEKLLIVGYIFGFGLGFRYLVEAVAEPGSPWTLAAIPFCLHTLVFMGFLNYSMAVALLLFQCGFWIRYAGRLTTGRVAILIGGLALMLLTHPVPVAMFFMFAGVYLLAGTAHEVATGNSWRKCLIARWRPLALTVAMGVIALAWVGLFWKPGASGGRAPSFVETWGWFNAIATELQLYPLAAFSRFRYRAAPILLLAFTCVALLAGLWKNRRNLRPAVTALLAASAACFLLYCVVPVRVSGGFYFEDRFPILWMLFLLAGTAGLRLPRAWSMAAGGLAVAVAAILLFQQRINVSEIASRIALVEQLPAAKPGSVGLIISPTHDVPYGLQFNPYMWSAVHYFRRSQAFLANDPWMDLPLIMLRPAHATRWSYLDPDDAYGPFIRSIVDGTSAGDFDFVVQMGSPDFEVDSLMRRSGWKCDSPASSLLRICRRDR
jgi:hypothetical protein